MALPELVTPSNVAAGFLLYNPGYRRTSYIYDSDWGPATELFCDSRGCTATDAWQTQLHEYVTGGVSRLWQLTLNARRVYGTMQSTSTTGMPVPSMWLAVLITTASMVRTPLRCRFR